MGRSRRIIEEERSEESYLKYVLNVPPQKGDV